MKRQLRTSQYLHVRSTYCTSTRTHTWLDMDRSSTSYCTVQYVVDADMQYSSSSVQFSCIHHSIIFHFIIFHLSFFLFSSTNMDEQTKTQRTGDGRIFLWAYVPTSSACDGGAMSRCRPGETFTHTHEQPTHKTSCQSSVFYPLFVFVLPWRRVQNR